jgi:pilus assembly protein Flp/PilA
MTNLLSRLLRDTGGATAVEYALMASLIALVIVLAVTTLGTKLNDLFANDDLKDALDG